MVQDPIEVWSDDLVCECAVQGIEKCAKHRSESCPSFKE